MASAKKIAANEIFFIINFIVPSLDLSGILLSASEQALCLARKREIKVISLKGVFRGGTRQLSRDTRWNIRASRAFDFFTVVQQGTILAPGSIARRANSADELPMKPRHQPRVLRAARKIR